MTKKLCLGSGIYEWDTVKEEANIRKHGIDFTTAALVLEGEYILYDDPDHSQNEYRYTAIGPVEQTLMFVRVSYTPRERDVVRIISARPADKREVKRYYEERGGF